MDANMQLRINSFRQLFSDKIFSLIFPIFSEIPDISLTAVKFPDISRFSRQVVSLSFISVIGKGVPYSRRSVGGVLISLS